MADPDPWNRNDPPPLGDEILGEMASRSPALAAYLQQQAGRDRPAVAPRPARVAVRRLLNFTASGVDGAVMKVVHNAQRTFRGQRFVATDSYGRPGHGTEILEAYVGAECVLPFNTATPTHVFARESTLEIMQAIEIAKLTSPTLVPHLEKLLLRRIAWDETMEKQWLAAARDTDLSVEDRQRIEMRAVAMDHEFDEDVAMPTTPRSRAVTWPIAHGGVPIVFKIKFLYPCTWTAQLWGDEAP